VYFFIVAVKILAGLVPGVIFEAGTFTNFHGFIDAARHKNEACSIQFEYVLYLGY